MVSMEKKSCVSSFCVHSRAGTLSLEISLFLTYIFIYHVTFVSTCYKKFFPTQLPQIFLRCPFVGQKKLISLSLLSSSDKNLRHCQGHIWHPIMLEMLRLPPFARFRRSAFFMETTGYLSPTKSILVEFSL